MQVCKVKASCMRKSNLKAIIYYKVIAFFAIFL